MYLQDIYTYPIKSLGGIRLSEAKVEIKGLALDRRWMLVDENGVFLSQRKHRQLALLQVEIIQNGLKIYHKQDPDRQLYIPFDPETDRHIPVTVWQDNVTGQVVSDEANKWFSDVVGFPSQLVYMSPSVERPIGEKYAVNSETVSFADAMPYLLIGQKSLDDLNNKLLEALPMNRFRPNLVFTGGEAFNEDSWDQVKIGDCLFKVTKPCARCVLTTIDQATAEAGKEPLKTLAGYRLFDKKILFGQNLIALTTGTVKVGDKVQPL